MFVQSQNKCYTWRLLNNYIVNDISDIIIEFLQQTCNNQYCGNICKICCHVCEYSCLCYNCITSCYICYDQDIRCDCVYSNQNMFTRKSYCACDDCGENYCYNCTGICDVPQHNTCILCMKKYWIRYTSYNG